MHARQGRHPGIPIMRGAPTLTFARGLYLASMSAPFLLVAGGPARRLQGGRASAPLQRSRVRTGCGCAQTHHTAALATPATEHSTRRPKAYLDMLAASTQAGWVTPNEWNLTCARGTGNLGNGGGGSVVAEGKLRESIRESRSTRCFFNHRQNSYARFLTPGFLFPH